MNIGELLSNFFVISLIKSALVAFVLLTALAYIQWVERKVLAHIQLRVGPRRVGPHGGVNAFSRRPRPIETGAKPSVMLFPITPRLNVKYGSIGLPRGQGHYRGRTRSVAIVFPNPSAAFQVACAILLRHRSYCRSRGGSNSRP